MLNENAKLWVAALRSGEFKQCHGKMTDGVGHCCLHVAAVIYERTTGNICESDDETCLEFGYKPVCEWLGLMEPQGSFESDSHIDSLVCLNDERKQTFSEIADIIESEPEGLLAKE